MQLNLKYRIFKQLKRWNLVTWYPRKLQKSVKEQWRIKVRTNKPKIVRLGVNKQKYQNKKLVLLRLNTLWKPVNILPLKRWAYHKRFYSEGLNLKRYYYYFFSLGLSHKYIKNLFNKVYYNKSKVLNDSYFYFLLKPYFRADVLLKVLGFSNSSFELRNALRTNIIRLGNKVGSLNPSYELQLGDIIHVNYFKNQFSFTTENSRRVFLKKVLNLFCEIDYYTRTVIMISSFKSILHSYENPQVFFKKFNIHKFISYLKSEH